LSRSPTALLRLSRGDKYSPKGFWQGSAVLS
jgi:hypothetical protein